MSWKNTIKYKYYGHESFYNSYAVLTAKVIKHPLPLEMVLISVVPLQKNMKSTNFPWP